MLTRKYGRYMDLISVVDDLSNVYVDKCDLFNALNSYEGQSILEEINYGHIV